MTTIEDIRALGYDAEECAPANSERVVYITGYGISSWFVGEAALASLVDPVAHVERVNQWKNGPPEPTSAAERPTPAEAAIAALNPKTATVEDVINALKNASL